MTEPITPEPVPPHRPRWLVPLLVAVVLVLVGATAVTTWALTRSPAPAAAPPAPTTAGTFAVHGTLQLDGVVSPGWPTGKECAGRGGYSDIREGTQVTVTGSDGTVLALGELSSGAVADTPDSVFEGIKSCMFTFSVPAVPAGHDIYGVEVAHRGVVRFDALDMFRDVSLTLG
jgi:hypothetical protein